MRAGSGADVDPLDGRSETLDERGDRNWAELLQELRVLQTGTQILTGFLLTLAFQQRFTDLSPAQVTSYLGLVVVAVAASVLALAPVALHRLLFRRRAKGDMVRIADGLVRGTLALVGLLFAGTAALIFDVAVGGVAAIVAGLAVAVLAAGLWLALPLGTRRRLRREAGR